MLALLKLVDNIEGKMIYPVHARHAFKIESPQFADNMQIILNGSSSSAAVRYQGSVSSVLECKSCKYQSIKREVFSCIEVLVPERSISSLENCLEI